MLKRCSSLRTMLFMQVPAGRVSDNEVAEQHNYFYLLEDNKIICFDTTASGSDKYWCEEFPIKDYEYANKWLNGEIEYSDYLEQKNEEDIEL